MCFFLFTLYFFLIITISFFVSFNTPFLDVMCTASFLCFRFFYCPFHCLRSTQKKRKHQKTHQHSLLRFQFLCLTLYLGIVWIHIQRMHSREQRLQKHEAMNPFIYQTPILCLFTLFSSTSFTTHTHLHATFTLHQTPPCLAFIVL